MIMPGRRFSAGGSYRFGFNGKEDDDEVKGDGNQQDYGMRIYDPRLGRFLSVDPISAKFPELSPYQFAGNMPIWAIDLDGLEPLPYNEWDKSGWSSIDNFNLTEGSKSHIKVINFGDMYGDGKKYIAIRDQKEAGKWWHASYEDQIGSYGNTQKGNYRLYNPTTEKYEPWIPDGWESDDAQIKSTARHLGEFGGAMENLVIQGTILGITGPLGGAGSWGSRLLLNTTIEVGVNGRNADAADIVTNSLPGVSGLIGVGAGAFLDWSPTSSQKSLRKFSSPFFPNTSFTNNKSFLSTGVDIITGATYEGLKFLPKKTLPNLTPNQMNFIDASGSVQEKAINRVMKDGVDGQNQIP
jgi:RHS repeat-associated protein